MELSISNVTYTNESHHSKLPFVRDVYIFITNYLVKDSTFFAGTCYFCYTPASLEQPLNRCGGCQLVSYCSRDCQKSRSVTFTTNTYFYPKNTYNAIILFSDTWKNQQKLFCMQC